MKQQVLASKKVAFIGAGNMAEALVNGLTGKTVCAPENITVSDIREERLAYFKETFGVAAVADNGEAASEADVIVLAVKPQQFGDVLPGLAKAIDRKRALVISIAAGIKTGRIEKELGEGVRVVRVMPNTPALVGMGAAAVCAGSAATEQDMETADAMLGSVGVVVRVEEKDIDAVTAVSGSGPAYVFYLIEAMQEAAGRMGLEDDVARQLILATVAGASELCSSTGEKASVLRERVTSKGGTTAAALAVMGGKGVKEAVVEAMLAAQKRSIELSNT